MKQLLSGIDWDIVSNNLDEKGYAHISRVLAPDICDELIETYDEQGIYRKTVTMELHRFGSGEYKYFDYPLPAAVQAIREEAYPKLSPVANGWMERLRIDTRFPSAFEELRERCRESGQNKPTPLILKYGKGGYNTLHQDLYGEVYFPIQLAIFLDEPGKDYTGGEFVLTEQVPRAQSRATVLTPKKGDMIIFTTNFRPMKGGRGYYRAAMRHGVSEIRGGARHTLGVIFHDALS